MALEVMYIGGQYAGFARQDTSDNTIEVCSWGGERVMRGGAVRGLCTPG